MAAYEDSDGDGSSEMTYYHQDHLGGTSLVTNEESLVVQLYDYYPYGSELINSQLTDTKVHHSFTDKELDDNLGLYYFEARWYDSSIGRFSSQDPIIFSGILSHDPQQINSYSYSRNNPVKYIDPTGREAYAVAKGLEASSYGTHVFILIIPDGGNGEAWIVGGYVGDDGNVVKGQNAESDVYALQSGNVKDIVEISPPSGTSDATFIDNIMDAYDSYANDAAYDPFAMDGYNSNNFATTLMTESGVEDLPWGGNAPGIDPGYGDPIPDDYTKANGTNNIPNGSSQTSSAVGNYSSSESGKSSAGWMDNLYEFVSSK